MAKKKRRRAGINDENRPPVQVTRYEPDPYMGLTREIVQERKAQGLDNQSVAPPSKTVGEIVKGNVLTYFNLIFLIISILLFSVQAYREMLFLPIIIMNALIGIVQELQAKKTLDNLNVLNAPKARVVREGKIHTIAAEGLVLDDIVIFQAGNQICADAVIMDGSVSVNEALLTGESDEIRKNPGDTLMSGSFLVSGTCYARLDKVGASSYINKLTAQAKTAKEGEQSEMIRSLNRIVLMAGISILPIGILLFYQSYMVQQSTLRDSITSAVAAVMGMIPEGLYLLSSVTLAAGVAKLAMKKVLVHDMKCIETLARVDVLCVDKTGTITENKMLVETVSTLPPYERDKSYPPIDELLSDFATAQSADNITMEAVKEFFTHPGTAQPVAVTGFSSAFKYSSVTFPDHAYVLGAPEFILKEQFETYKDEIEEHSSKGFRVLVLASYGGTPDGYALTGSVTPLALVVIANKIRKDADKTFRYFHNQGVDIKVISGDNPLTVSEVATQAGIYHADLYIDASTLKTKEELAKAVEEYTVFGRVTPAQKRQFVHALKEAGHTVAMTGDGVNDVLALKDADCSVAMAAGSDAAAQASQLVLLDNDFSHMPQIVLEGRQIVNNMERSGSLFLVKNLFSLLLALFSIIFGFSYPLKPAQLSMISMFTIGAPGFFLSQVPNRDLIQGSFIRNVLKKALPAAATDFIVIASLVVFGEVFNISSYDISTACAILSAIIGFMILYHIIQPMDKYKWGILGGCMAGMLFSLVFLRGFFGITSMSMRCVMLFVVFSITTEPILRYLIRLTDFISKRFVRDESGPKSRHHMAAAKKAIRRPRRPHESAGRKSREG
ncbi:MAG: HAD-IC family P-type ATPase [Eubacterium sp.]|nr:HAD-IC family P-type ATPase [Eubacterium sp.]